jgi:hypothetical protein
LDTFIEEHEGCESGIAPSSHNEKVANEVREYLNGSNEGGGEIDPLLFWLGTKAYQTIQPVIRVLFGMQATSVPCESLFSRTGLATPTIRNRQLPATLEKRILSDNWAKHATVNFMGEDVFKAVSVAVGGSVFGLKWAEDCNTADCEVMDSNDELEEE